MDWLDALIMGIVQGLSEYLPISSSGHLEICNKILGLNLNPEDSLQFDVMLHVATVLSTIVILWREFVPLCRSFFTFRQDDNFRYVCKLLVSAIPVAVVGLCLKSTIEGFFGGNLVVVGCCLCVTALLLSFAYFMRTRPALSGMAPEGHDITWLDAIIIGCAQAVAVLPGLSRSGTTIATGILLGDRRDKMAQFSFFMVIIPIIGQALLDVKEMIGGESTAADTIGWLPLVVGFISAFIVGCFACKWMIEIVKRGKLVWFALYCLLMGILCIVW